jgi:hypothetical protein
MKCKDLTIEIQRMWHVKLKVIPVIIGATTTISNHSENIRATCRESQTSMNYRKQPYWHCTHTAESNDVKVLNF